MLPLKIFYIRITEVWWMKTAYSLQPGSCSSSSKIKDITLVIITQSCLMWVLFFLKMKMPFRIQKMTSRDTKLYKINLGNKGTYWGDGNVGLDRGMGYTGVCICQKRSRGMLESICLTLWKLLRNSQKRKPTWSQPSWLKPTTSKVFRTLTHCATIFSLAVVSNLLTPPQLLCFPSSH